MASNSTTPKIVNPWQAQGIESFQDSGSLEVDENVLNSADSALGGMSLLSSSASVSSTLYEHVEENGRTYHRFKEGQYPLPNDEPEQDRLEFQHRLFRLSLDGKLYLSPIKEGPITVLDIATGTGAWAIDFANEHPEATVIGTDLSPIQPSLLPPNCSFLIEDAEEDWNFTENFDFIYGRTLVSCFKDPKAVFARAFDALVPGGYLELRDPIFPFKFLDPPPENSPLAEWNRLIVEAAAEAGRPWNNGQYYKTWMEELGFVDIVEKKEFATLSPWAKGRRSKYLSVWLRHDIETGLEAWSMALFTRVLKWTPERLHALLEAVRRDLHDTSIHAYSEGVLVYGRKPLL